MNRGNWEKYGRFSLVLQSFVDEIDVKGKVRKAGKGEKEDKRSTKYGRYIRRLGKPMPKFYLGA